MAEEGPDAGQGQAAPPARLPGVELSPAVCAELLDPSVWREGLEKYARAMHLAVAVVDAQGRLLGECLNPQPLWAYLREGRLAGGGDCPFCLVPPGPCPCVADALATGHLALVRDRTGLVHFAVPLALNGHKLGALLAGQVFDQYPEQLALEQAAQKLGLSPSEVGRKAHRERPVSRATLQVYGDLLAALGNAFLEGRYRARQEQVRLVERDRAEGLLREARDGLERRVQERTAELEEAQQKALNAERLAAIGQMAAGLAHESRNLLQSSQSCLERLGWRLQGDPEALDLLARARAAQRSLHTLFEDVRTYAAPLRLEVGPCHLGELWRQTWAEVRADFPDRQAELREDVAGVDLWCTADRFRLGQVFRNVLENACAAVAGAVRVAVTCRPANLGGRPALRVAVRDNGPGLNAEQRARVFEAFYTTKTKGTGLGMAIAKRIVEAHGGRLAVGEAGPPGAEFVLLLPRSPS